jgi:hypothetical protein
MKISKALISVFLASLFVATTALGDSFAGAREFLALTLSGVDASSSERCDLVVTEQGYTGPEQTPDQWYANVTTSYSHDGTTAEPFLLKIHPTRPGVLFGTGSNGQDQLAVFLDPQGLDLQNAKSFNLKWLHGDHIHTNRCVNMSAL